MDKNEVLKILETAKDENGEVPMRLVRQAFEKLPESCEDAVSRKLILDKIKEVCFSRKQEWVDFRVSQGSNGQRDLIIKFIESLPSIQPR